MTRLLVLAPRRQPVGSGGVSPRASIQATTLDLLWIRDGVVCFAGARDSAPLLRAVLSLDGPAHTPSALADADLRGREPDAARRIHGLEHVVRKLFEIVIKSDNLRRRNF